MPKNKERVENISIQEFENDNQDFRDEFLKMFGKKEDTTKSNESQEQDIKKAIETLELAFIRGQINKEQFEKSMSNYRNKEKLTLTDYHRKRNEIAIKAVEEMSKQPFSAQQLKEQTENVLKMGRYFASQDYVNKEVYETKLKPLIKQFLDENKEILKSIGVDIFNWE